MLKAEEQMELAVLKKHGASIRGLSRSTGRSRNTVRRYLRGGDGIFRVHVAEAERVTGLAAVEAGVFNDSDADVITKCIDDSGTNAAACRAPGNDQAIGAEQRQVTHQIASKKDAWLLLINNNVLRLRRKFGNDFVRITVGGFRRRRFGGAIVLPGPAAQIPVIHAEEAGRINHRQPLSAKQIGKVFDDRYR